MTSDKLKDAERALSVYWANDPKWDTDDDVAAKAALETLVNIARAAQDACDYGDAKRIRALATALAALNKDTG